MDKEVLLWCCIDIYVTKRYNFAKTFSPRKSGFIVVNLHISLSLSLSLSLSPL